MSWTDLFGIDFEENENYVRTSDHNPVLDARDKVISRYSDFVKSADYDLFTDSEKKAVKDQINRIQSDLAEQGLKWQERNAAEALAEDAALKQQIADDTYQALKDNVSFAGGGWDKLSGAADWVKNQALVNVIDLGKYAVENTQNLPMDTLSFGLNTIGVGKEWADMLEQQASDNRQAFAGVVGEGKGFVEGDAFDRLRAGVGAVTNMGTLVYSPSLYLMGAVAGKVVSGLGKMTGINKLATRMFGLADASVLAEKGIEYSTAEGLAEAGAKLMQLNKINSWNFGKGALGYAMGKTASAIPTALTMSIPELYSDSVKYDALGNVILPDSEKMMHIALVSLPHAIIENYNINPQTFGKEAAEKLGLKQIWSKSFKEAFGEGVEEIAQGFLSLVEKNWGEKDPTTGKTMDLGYAIAKAASDIYDDENKSLLNMAEEFIGGAVGGFFMNLGQGYANHSDLNMQQQYQKTLNEIASGVDTDAVEMEKAGIADFSALREAQQNITAIGQQIKDVTDRINADNYTDESKRKGDIVLQKTLEKEADYRAAQLQAAAESAVNDYGNGLVILEQMNADFYQRQQQIQAAREMLAQQIADTSDNPALISAAQKSAEKQVTLGDAVQSGDFSNEAYKDKIDSSIKTFKTDAQTLREFKKNNPKIVAEAEKRIKEEEEKFNAAKKKAVEAEKAKPAPEQRTESELEEAMREYQSDSTDFVGNFDDFLRAKDQEDAEIKKDIEAEIQKDIDSNTQKPNGELWVDDYIRQLADSKARLEEEEKNIAAITDKKSDEYKHKKVFVDRLKEEIKWLEDNIAKLQGNTESEQAIKTDTLAGLSEEDKQILDDIEVDNAQIDEELKQYETQLANSAEHSYDYEQAKDQIQFLKSQKATNDKQKKEIMDKAAAYKAPERKAKSRKVGSRNLYGKKADAIAAAEKMLEEDKKQGKAKADATVKDTYTVAKTKFGYQVKKRAYRQKTLDGKDAVDKTAAQKKVDEVNKKLTKKKNKSGKKVRVELVEDQSQVQGFVQSLRRNVFTGIVEKVGTFIEGATEDNGGEIVVKIVRNNIDSMDRLDEVIAHELLHAGLRYVLNKAQRSYILHEVNRLIDSDKAFAEKVMPTISDYVGAGRNVQLEEVLARLAETIDEESPNTVKRIWNKIVSTVYKALRRLGLTTNLHKSELTDIIKGLRNDLTQPGSTFHYTKGMMGNQASAKAMFRADNMRKALDELSKGEELFTYDINDGKPLASLKTWDEGGRAALVKYLQKAFKAGEISRKDADDLVKTMDDIADTCRIMAYDAPDSEFGKWSQVGVDYDSQGKPYFTVVRQNGDYAMNIDFSTVCKKRRALNNVLNEIVKRGYLTEHGDLTQKDVVDIQEAIKNHGFEVACALCFVDSKRYNIGKQAKNIVDKWNKMYKSFVEGTDFYKEHLEKALARLADGKKAKNQEQRIALAINSDEKDADGNYKYRRELTADWLISSGSREMIGGHDNLAKNYPRIFEVLNGYGSGKSKNSHMDVAWNNDIINAFAAVNNPNVTNFDPEKAKSIGGVRLQSFSDFIPTMFFDYVQCISELTAKKLTAHCYTKEADFVKLFGSCGIKTNMSLVYANKGCQKISKAEYDRIRKEKGDAFVTTLKDKGKTVYYEYLYTDLDPEHPQSFNPTEAFRLREDPRYADSCGTIAVAVSEEHLKVLLADPRIDMVIPYHKSGISKEVAAMRNINEYVDFTKKQTERDNITGYLLNDKVDEHKAALKKSGAYGKHFDFYGDLENTKDPRQTANNYLAWCKDNNLTSKFNDYTSNQNYYKLLADFKLYKQDSEGNEVYVPQKEVKLNLNKDYQQVLSNALDVNQKIADKFAGDIDNLLETCKQILDANLAESKAKKSAKGKTKSKAVIKFNKKKGTYKVAGNIDKTKVKPSRAKLFKTNKKSGIVTLKNNVMLSLKSTVAEKLRSDLLNAIPDNSDLREEYRDGSTKNYPDQLKMYDYITAEGENIADIDSLLESRQSSPESQYTLNKMAKQFVAAFPGKVGRMLAENCQIIRKSLQKDGISKKKINAVTVDDIINSPVQNIFGYGSYAETEGEQKFENYAESNRTYAESQKAAAEEGRQMYDENLKKYQSLDSLMKDVEAEHVRFSLKSTDTERDGQQWQQDVLAKESPEAAKILSKINYYKLNPDSVAAKSHLPLLYAKLRKIVSKMDNDSLLAKSIGEDIVFNNTERFKDRTPKFSIEKGFNYIPRTLAMMAEDVTNMKTGYENVPNSLLGFSRSDRPQKGYDEQKYKYVLDYYYSVDNGKTWNKDSIKGLNKKQAIERAKRDLPEGLIRIPSKSDVRFSFKSAQSDQEYLDAVNSGDMETAQRMVDEAAKAAGYKIVAYHGTEAQFNVFDRTKSRSNMDIQGNFFSPWEDDAKGYGRNVRKFYIKLNNPATFGQGLKALKMFQGLNKAGEKAANYLIKKGYDGVNNDDEEYIVFDSENIKSADPVTRDDADNVIPLSERFNPKKKDIRYSLKSDRSDVARQLYAKYFDNNGELIENKDEVIAYNGNSNDNGIEAIESRQPFGTNVFFSPYGSYGHEYVTKFLKKDIAQKYDLKHGDYTEAQDSIIQEFADKWGITYDDAYDCLTEQNVYKTFKEDDGEFRFNSDKLSDMSWDAQNFGLKLAKSLGFKVFEDEDEQGTYYLADGLETDMVWNGGDEISKHVIHNGKRYELEPKKNIRYSKRKSNYIDFESISYSELQKLASEINTNKLSSKDRKEFDTINVGDYLYAYHDYKIFEPLEAYTPDNLKIVFRINVYDLDRDSLNKIEKDYKNGNIRNRREFNRFFTRNKRIKGKDYRNNPYAQRERRSDDGARLLHGRERGTYRGRDNEESSGTLSESSEGTPNRGINTDKPRFSLKKSLREQYHDQLADAAKRIAERQAKVLSNSKKGIKARAADYLDRAEYNWADRRFYLRKWQENIEETLKNSPLMASLFDGDNLKDNVDVSALWDTVDGRIQTNRDNFVKDYWDKFYDMATDNKVTYDDLNRYLFARHAEERDAYIASINPEFASGGHGSGWDDSWGTPDEEKKRLEKKYGYQLMRDIGVAYDEMTQALVDKQLEYHLISKATADMLKNRYKHYVPLKRFDDAERHGYTNNPAETNINQKINARAYGRESQPEHMLTFAKANIDTVFRRGERNMVKLAMLNLATRLNDVNIQVDRKVVKRTLDRNGDVTYAVDRSSDAKENTIFATKGDATFSITFHNQELYNAFISDDMTSGLLQSIVHALRGITGIMGSNATSRNIEFGLVNLAKDQQQALAENLIYRGNGKSMYDFAVSAIKNIPVAAKTFLKNSMINSSLAKKAGIKVTDDADTRMFREFLKYGGTTGYIDIYRLTDDARKLEQQMDEKTMTFLQRWKKWKDEGRLTEKAKAQAEEWIARVMAPLEFINDLFEQITRFSNYRAARQAGLSPLKAAELSKNLTINFNRHGALWTSKFNWAYMFSNASLQGTAKTIRMYQKAFDDNAKPSEKKAARYILGTAITAGIAAQILGRLFSGDDDEDKLKFYDKLDSSIKDNNVVIMLGNDSYIKIPLFIGAAFPFMMARNATALMDGTQSIGESTTNILQNMADYFSPLGNAADNKEGQGAVVKSIMPTALRPFLDVSYNSNFAGSRIYAASYNSTKPTHTRAFSKTPKFYVELSKVMNRISGGNNLQKGYMDIPPEAIQHVVESYLGGTGKFFGRGYDTFAKIISGETPNLGNVPFVRRFADTVGDSYVYDEFKKNEQLYSTLNNARSEKDEEILEQYPQYKTFLKTMASHREKVRNAKTPEEKISLIKKANAELRSLKNKK